MIYILKTNEIYLGDCIDLMKNIDNDSIDLTITSPPYDNLRSYNDSLEWNFDVFKSVANEMFRITKQGGIIVWIVGDATIKGSETGSSFRQALYFKDIGFNLHDTMIWNKNSFSAVGSLKTRYAPVFEYMFILSKGKIKTFNPIKDKPNKWAGDKRKHVYNRQSDGSTTKSKGYVLGEFGQRYNVWDIFPHRQKGKNKHPAPFPEQLAHDHIISWSNEGDVVFDPFVGSGTTCKMAIINSRNYIGVEKDEEYFKMAKNRISEASNTNRSATT